MEIVQLPVGRAASETCDCVQIQELSNGRFELAGSVLLQCGDGNECESVSITSSEPYGSFDEAEAAGLAWASEHCVARLYVVRSNGTEQLPDIFDLPTA